MCFLSFLIFSVIFCPTEFFGNLPVLSFSCLLVDAWWSSSGVGWRVCGPRTITLHHSYFLWSFSASSPFFTSQECDCTLSPRRHHTLFHLSSDISSSSFLKNIISNEIKTAMEISLVLSVIWSMGSSILLYWLCAL